MPVRVVTVTGTGPAVTPGGTVTLIVVGDRTVKNRAGIAPNRITVAPVRLTP